MINHFDALGVDQKISKDALKKRFDSLTIALTNTKRSSKQDKKYGKILDRMQESYAVLADPRLRKEHEKQLQLAADPYSPEKLKPLFGHMCVAADLISYEDLKKALKKQSKANLALGQILEDEGLITQTEADGILMGQQLYDAPSHPLGTLTRQLLALELVDLDMVKIALLDERRFLDGLNILLVKRGWIASDVVTVLAIQTEEAASK